MDDEKLDLQDYMDKALIDWTFDQLKKKCDVCGEKGDWELVECFMCGNDVIGE